MKMAPLSEEATEKGFVNYLPLTSCEPGSSSSLPSRSHHNHHKDQQIGQYVLKGFTDYYDNECYGIHEADRAA
jgi:hypothetical protein